MNTDEARARFSSARVARLATADSDGRPHVVPIVFAVSGDVIYSAVDDKPKRSRALRRLANIRVNPSVALLVDHYEENWGALWWVRAEGQGRLLEDRGAAEALRALELLGERYPQQEGADTVLAVDVSRWSGWSAGG